MGNSANSAKTEKPKGNSNEAHRREHKAKFAQVHKHKEKKQKMSHKKRNKCRGEVSEMEEGEGGKSIFIIKYFD